MLQTSIPSSTLSFGSDSLTSQEMWSKISWLLLIGARSISVKNATIIAGTVKKVKIIKKMMVKIIV